MSAVLRPAGDLVDELAPYDFALPPDLIAQEPAEPRDAARLLVLGPAARGAPGRAG